MLHPGPITADGGNLAVSLERGVAAALDEASAAAGDAHAFIGAAWYAAAAGEGKVSTLVLRRSGTGEALAAIPLSLRRIGLLTLREVPGSYWPYRSFPVAADHGSEALAALLDSPLGRSAFGRAWRVGPIHADDPAAIALAAAAPRTGWTVLTRRLATCYVLDLERLAASGNWPSAKRRQTLRWRERKLMRHGSITVSTVSGAAWTPGVFDRLARIEAESWVAREAPPSDLKFLAGATGRHVWERLVADPAFAERLACWILDVEGEPAAFVFTVGAGSVRHVVANGYSERFAHGSPGLLLLFRCFSDLAAAGVRRIGWGAGDAGYKSDMGAEPGPEIVDLLLVRGRALAAALRPLWERRGRP